MENIDKNQNNEIEKYKNWKSKIIRFLTAQTVSLFGSSIVQYAIVWHIVLKTSSAKMMTITALCAFAPQLIISLFAGVWLDRYNRKILIMLSDGAIALSTLTLALLFIFGYDNLWMLFVVLAVRSAGTGIQTPGVNSIIPMISPKEELMKINGVYGSLSSIIYFISPAISALILTLSGITATLFIDVITAIIGIAITSSIHIENIKHENIKINSHLEDIKEGFRYLKDHKLVRRLILFTVFVYIFISPSAMLTPVLINTVFGKEVWRLTLSEMTFSGGMFIGGLIIAKYKGFKNNMHTSILAGIFYSILMTILGASALFSYASMSIMFIVYIIANFLIGITSPCYTTPINVMIQEKVEPSKHGRVFSIMQIAISSSIPFGMLVFGPIADAITVQTLLIINGFILLCFSAFVVKNKIFD